MGVGGGAYLDRDGRAEFADDGREGVEVVDMAVLKEFSSLLLAVGVLGGGSTLLDVSKQSVSICGGNDSASPMTGSEWIVLPSLLSLLLFWCWWLLVGGSPPVALEDTGLDCSGPAPLVTLRSVSGFATTRLSTSFRCISTARR